MRGPSQVSLTWTQSTDDLATFLGYRIFANGAPVTEHVNWYGERSVVLRHHAPAGGEVWVGWTQSTDDTDPQSAIEYEIDVNGF